LIGVDIFFCLLSAKDDDFVENFDQEQSTDEVKSFKDDLSPEKPFSRNLCNIDAWLFACHLEQQARAHHKY